MYSSNYGYGGYEELMAVLAVFGVIFAIIGIIGLVFWILRSIGLTKIASNRGMAAPAVAWIPVIGIFTLGAIADDIAEKETGRKTPFRILLLIGTLLSQGLSYGSLIPSVIAAMDYYGSYNTASTLASSGLSLLGWMLSLAVYVVTIIALYRVFKCYRPDSAVMYTVLSAIPGISFLKNIFLFIMRNDQPKEPYQSYPQGNGYGGYPGQGGYPQQPQGGYTLQGGYPQQPQSDYPPQGGYPQQPQDNYPPQGGYPQQPQGDYPPQGGYPQQPQDDYPPQSDSSQGGIAQPNSAPDMYDEPSPPKDDN